MITISEFELKRQYRKYSRKGHCFECGVGTGSRHSKDCVYATRPMPDSKRVQKDLNVFSGAVRIII